MITVSHYIFDEALTPFIFFSFISQKRICIATRLMVRLVRVLSLSVSILLYVFEVHEETRRWTNVLVAASRLIVVEATMLQLAKS